MFDHYIPLTEKQIQDIWKDSLFVFDTNVLLHLYRYNVSLREKLLSIIHQPIILDRIWIPAKVYEEFLKNRVVVMCEQWSIEEKINSIVKNGILEIEEKISKCFTFTYHPYINKEKVVSLLGETNGNISSNIIHDKEINYNIDINNDTLLEDIRNTLTGKIGNELTADELDQIFINGKERYKKKIPPGFEDENKPEPDRYSDLVIWQSIIKQAKTGKNIIFIMDDKKEDWWRKEKGRKVGPQPMLLKEFYQETGRLILLYDSDQFYKYGAFVKCCVRHSLS
jgi:hypothetical protein